MILIDHVHLVSDTSLAELRAFAESIGLPRRWYRRGHYDVWGTRYRKAIRAGAVEISSREVVRRMVGHGR